MGHDQTGFVQNRQSYSNIRTLLGILQYVKITGLNALVVTLDAEKDDHMDALYLLYYLHY